MKKYSFINEGIAGAIAMDMAHKGRTVYQNHKLAGLQAKAQSNTQDSQAQKRAILYQQKVAARQAKLQQIEQQKQARRMQQMQKK